jgi:methylamine dehydrogenase heavy chain
LSKGSSHAPRRQPPRRSRYYCAVQRRRAGDRDDYPQPLPEEPVPGNGRAVRRNIRTAGSSFTTCISTVCPTVASAIVDVAAENPRNVKGQMPAAQFGNILPATTKPEIYVGETFLSRLTRGERTDVITIWDTKATLTPKGEIVLPGGKRGLFVTLKNSLQLTNNEKWALLFNFTPDRR